MYTRMDGIARLRKAIAGKLAWTHGIEVDPEREVMVASGATGALHATAMALLNPGDEVLVFEPYYGYHLTTLRSMKIVPVSVKLTVPEQGSAWALDMAAVRGGDYAEDPGDGGEYAVESSGQGIHARGDRRAGGDCCGV